MAVCETEAPQHLIHLINNTNNVPSPQIFFDVNHPQMLHSCKKKMSGDRHNKRLKHTISHTNNKARVYADHIGQEWQQQTTELVTIHKNHVENKSKKTKKDKGDKASKKNDVLPVSNINDENRSQSVFQQQRALQHNPTDLASPGLLNPQSHDGRCNSTPSSNPFSVPPSGQPDNMRFFEEFSPASMDLVDDNFLDALSAGHDFIDGDISAMLDGICGELVPESPLLRTVDALDYYPRFPGEGEPVMKSEPFPGMMDRNNQQQSFLMHQQHQNSNNYPLPGAAFSHPRNPTNSVPPMGHYGNNMPPHQLPSDQLQLHRMEQSRRNQQQQQEDVILGRVGPNPNMMLPTNRQAMPQIPQQQPPEMHFRMKQPVSSSASFGAQDVPNANFPNQMPPSQMNPNSYNAQPNAYARQMPMENGTRQVQMNQMNRPSNGDIRWSSPEMNYQQQVNNGFEFNNGGYSQQMQTPRTPYNQQRPRQPTRNYQPPQMMNGANAQQYSSQLQQPPVYHSDARQMTAYRPAMNANNYAGVRMQQQPQYAQPNYYPQQAGFAADQQVFAEQQHYGDVGPWNGA